MGRVIIFVIVGVFSIFITYKIIPYLVYSFTKIEGKAVIIENSDDEIVYSYYDEFKSKVIKRKRNLEYDSDLEDIQPKDSINIYYSGNGIVNITSEDSQFIYVLYLIVLIICWIAFYQYFLVLIGKKELTQIFNLQSKSSK